MTTQRIVQKSKAGVQDLVLGKGQVEQTRGGGQYQIDRLDIPLALDSIAEMQALDVTDFTRARVYSDETTFVDYIYDPSSDLGIQPIDSAFEGSWFVVNFDTGEINVKDFGALGDDFTDDSSAFNRASAVGRELRGKLIIPEGIYTLASPWIVGGESDNRGVTIEGYGDTKSIVKMADNANINLLVDRRWDENSPFSTGSIHIRNLGLDGNKANNTSGSIAIFKPFFLRLEGVTVYDSPTHGFVTTDKNKDGSQSGSGGDNKFIDCKFNGCNGNGFRQENTYNSTADFWFLNCIISGNGSAGFSQMKLERAAGLVMDFCRFFAGHFDDLEVDDIGGCNLSNMHMDLRCTSAIGGGTYSSIRVNTFGSPSFLPSFNLTNVIFKLVTKGEQGVDIPATATVNAIGVRGGTKGTINISNCTVRPDTAANVEIFQNDGSANIRGKLDGFVSYDNDQTNSATPHTQFGNLYPVLTGHVDSIDPREFGARGGFIDDFNAIQAALNAGADLGKKVRMVNLDSNLSEGLSIPSNTIFEGINSTLNPSPSNGSGNGKLFRCTASTNNVQIRGLKLQGNSAGSPALTPLTQLFNCSNILIEDCFFADSAGIAINASTSLSTITIRNNRFRLIGYTTGVGGDDAKQAIAFSSGGHSNVNIQNNSFESIGLDCISIGGITVGDVSGNYHADDKCYALIYNDANSFLMNISNNRAKTAVNVGGSTRPEGIGIDLPNLKDSVVSDNVCRACSSGGIGIFSNSAGVQVTGNYCVDNNQSGGAIHDAGIIVRLTTGPINVSGNFSGNRNGSTQTNGYIIDNAQGELISLQRSNKVNSVTTEVLHATFTSPTDIGTPVYTYGIPLRLQGNGSPEGTKTAPIGSEYTRLDGGAGTTFYYKESGSGSTGWVAK